MVEVPGGFSPRQDRQEVLIRQLQGASKQPFSFGAGWVNGSGSFPGFEDCSVSRHGRLVILQGITTKTGGAPAAGDVIGTLPVGFRPAARLIFPVVAKDVFGRVDVLANGQVQWLAGGTAETDYTSLAGIAFVVDP